MTPLREAMIRAMQVRGFSARTHKSYLAAVTDLARYHRRSPAELEIEDLCRYFEHLAIERELSSASCRLALNGIRFLYLNVLERPAFDVPIPVPKRPQRIPELLSRAEVARILAACGSSKYQTMLALCYGCGLRVSELLAVRVRDIAYSGPCRPLIPAHAGPAFRAMSGHRSGACRATIPVMPGQRSGGCRTEV